VDAIDATTCKAAKKANQNTNAMRLFDQHDDEYIVTIKKRNALQADDGPHLNRHVISTDGDCDPTHQGPHQSGQAD
jgi:hypothetical protein